jgi:hypothetical protein
MPRSGHGLAAPFQFESESHRAQRFAPGEIRAPAQTGPLPWRERFALRRLDELERKLARQKRRAEVHVVPSFTLSLADMSGHRTRTGHSF